MTLREVIVGTIYAWDGTHTCDSLANTIITALDAAGYWIAPKEPTEGMSLSGRKACAVVADRMETAKLTSASVIDFWQRVGHKPADEIYLAMRDQWMKENGG